MTYYPKTQTSILSNSGLTQNTGSEFFQHLESQNEGVPGGPRPAQFNINEIRLVHELERCNLTGFQIVTCINALRPDLDDQTILSHTNGGVNSNFKGELIAACMANMLPAPQFQVQVFGPPHRCYFRASCTVKDFTILGGERLNKKAAENDAAGVMLDFVRARGSPLKDLTRYGVEPNPGPEDIGTETSAPAFKYHGNYGGPNYSAGEYNGRYRTSNEYREAMFANPPTDEWDAAYQRHDLGYHVGEEETADQILIDELADAPIKHQLSRAYFKAKQALGLKHTKPVTKQEINKAVRQVAQENRKNRLKLMLNTPKYEPPKPPLVGVEPNPGPPKPNPQKNKNPKKQKPKNHNRKKDETTKAPVSIGVKMTSSKPQIQRTKMGVIVHHRELVATLTSATSGDGVLMYQPVYPTNSTLWPWLAVQGQLYEQYIVRQLKFCFRTDLGTNTAGAVYLAMDYDCNDSPPSSKQDISQMDGCVRTSAWQPADCIVNPRKLKRVNAYIIRSGTDGATIPHSDYDIGNFVIFTSGISSGLIFGDVYAEYTIEFRIPAQVNITADSVFESSWNGITMSTSTPLGTGWNVLQDNTTIMYPYVAQGTTVANYSQMAFKKPGRYVVTIYTEGSNLGSAVFNISVLTRLNQKNDPAGSWVRTFTTSTTSQFVRFALDATSAASPNKPGILTIGTTGAYSTATFAGTGFLMVVPMVSASPVSVVRFPILNGMEQTHIGNRPLQLKEDEVDKIARLEERLQQLEVSGLESEWTPTLDTSACPSPKLGTSGGMDAHSLRQALIMSQQRSLPGLR